MAYVEDREKKRARMKTWREANRDHIQAYQKQWRAKNAEAVSEYNKAYQAEYQGRPDVQFETWVRNLWKSYKLTAHQFNQMWEAQQGKCAICQCEMLPRGRDKAAACVDHNHDTGAVRALLCRGCNHGIGNLKEDPDVLKRAAEYLLTHGYHSHLNRLR